MEGVFGPRVEVEVPDLEQAGWILGGGGILGVGG